MRRRAELAKLFEERGKADAAPRDAPAFLALAKSGAANIEPELYLDTFWETWLPLVRSDEISREAAVRLGEMFAERYRDASVRYAVSAALAVNATGELSRLAEVLASSDREQNDAGLQRAIQVVPALAARN